MLRALTISASERSMASVNTPAVRTVMPSAIVKSASRSSTTKSWAGLAVPAPAARLIDTVEVESVAIWMSRLESVVVLAKTMSMSLASVVVMLPLTLQEMLSE